MVFSNNLMYIFYILISWILLFSTSYFVIKYVNFFDNISRLIKINFILSFSFACLGFTIGTLLGGSRTSVIGEVIPALLIFISGISGYLVVKDSNFNNQVQISLATICLSIFILYGAEIGAISRIRLEKKLQKEIRDYERYLLDVKYNISKKELLLKDSLEKSKSIKNDTLKIKK